MLHATGQETGEVEVVKSWRHLQGPATCTEVGFYSESNMHEKKKWPDPSAVRRPD